MSASLQFLLAILSVSVLCGCAAPTDDTRLTDLDERYVTTYYDRNRDGTVDFELHRLPGGADTDWALSDTHFRGRYDLRIRWGYVIQKDAVDVPVPKGVTITPGKPPVLETE